MSGQHKRLRQLRESLRTADGRRVDRHALGDVLGWPDSRWKNLEGNMLWGEDSRVWVREGLLALVARTTLPEGAGQQAVRFVMGEAKALPWSSPPTWLEGKGPAPRPVGRPRLREVPPSTSNVVPGVFSRAMLKAQIGAVLSLFQPVMRGPDGLTRAVEPEEFLRLSGRDGWTFVPGRIDRDAAADAIGDLLLYYNKYEAHSPDVA